MKKLILISILLILVGFTALLVGMVPFHFYQQAINSGMDSEYLKLAGPIERLMKGEEYPMTREKGLYGEDEEFWRKFHFQDFYVSLPVRHPNYIFIPVVKKLEKGYQIGAKLANQNKKELGSFALGEPFKFQVDLGDNKLFNLPIFKNYILNKNVKDVWKDLFTLDIHDEGLSLMKPMGSIEKMINVDYKEMVYKLYILDLRSKIFKYPFTKLTWHSETKTGILINEKDDVYEESILNFEKGRVHPFLITIIKNDIVAEALRKRFVTKTYFGLSNMESALTIYAEYKKLDYIEKIGQTGMTYLFVAWTHNMKKREFLREMIQFLERGKDNNIYLRPLYNYSLEMFGTTFSGIKGELRETSEEKLKRKISEELENKITEEKNKVETSQEGKFENVEERMKYFLQKAKDENVDTDDENKMIIVD